jgi:tetratricopeptide (TPR) repeat protein
MTLLEQHQYERAVALLQQAQQAPDTQIAAQAQLQLGRAYSLGGDLQEGINAYLRVAYLYPDAGRLVTGALQQAARNYVKLGKCPEALTVYTKLLEQTPAAQETQAIQQEMQQSGCQ